jgi:hypothetical protein
MVYLIDPKNGSVYWCDASTLMFAPLSTDNTFDTDEGGEVDFARLDEEDRVYMEKIKERLC